MLLSTDSAISLLLQSNKSPSDSQVAYFRARLEENNKEIKKLNTQKLKWKRKMDKEEAEQAMILCLLSPFRRIPDDICREIFLACVPQDLNTCDPNINEAPLVLARVCSRWRTIALETATLWTNIVIQPQKAQRQQQRFLELRKNRNAVERRVQEWARLSKQAPLQVYMDLGSADLFFGNVAEWAVDKILRPLAPRLHHLTLRGEEIYPLLKGSAFSEHGTFPELRSIILEELNWLPGDLEGEVLDGDDELAASSNALSILPGSTKLHSADITLFPCNPNPLALPHSSLARLHTCYPRRIGGTTATLGPYKNLRYLRLTDVKIDDHGRPGSGPRPTVHSIESLSLAFEDSCGRAIQRIGVLEDMEFPSLKALHLSSTGLDPDRGHRTDAAWFSHPRTASALSNLTSLDLEKCMGRRHKHVLNLLQTTPKLRKLRIALRADVDTAKCYFTKALTLSTNQRIVPVLEELGLDIATISRGGINGMVASRTQGTDKLRRVVVYGSIQSNAMDRAKYPVIPGVEVIAQETIAPEELRGYKPLWTNWSSGLNHLKEAKEDSDDDSDDDSWWTEL